MDILRSKLQRTIKLSTVSSAFVQRAFQSSEAIPSGSLLIWGSGDTGQLGCNVDKADVPIHLDEFHGKSIEDVAVSSSTSFAVTDAGELYSWGKCEYGSLGHGTASQTVSSPAAIRALDGIKVVQVSISFQIANRRGLFVLFSSLTTVDTQAPIMQLQCQTKAICLRGDGEAVSCSVCVMDAAMLRT